MLSEKQVSLEPCVLSSNLIERRKNHIYIKSSDLYLYVCNINFLFDFDYNVSSVLKGQNFYEIKTFH